ncbi:MAG: MFS transporter [Proteobacteria bacterium]|nr:MFS transporter [Pseudomonadota bacterium]
MTAQVATVRPMSEGRTTTIVALMALAVFINYVDRGNLATAAPLMKDELKLDNTQVGLLLSAFFWAYTPGQVLAGWLAERINAYRALALGLTVWALATVATGLAGSFALLFALRLVLGLGESVAFPCSSKLLAEYLPTHRLGHANGMIGAGLAAGPAVGTFVGGLLIARFGWRPSFLVFGLVSLMWLAPWLAATRAASGEASKAPAGPVPSFLAILRRRALWGAALGHFAANYTLYFVVSWLPTYLVKARGFTVPQMAEIGGAIYLVYAASSLTVGWVCDRWMAAGAGDNRVRKTAMIAGHAGAAACLAACAVTGPIGSLVSLLLAGFFFGFTTPNIFAIGQTLAGPRAAGKWIGVQNCIGNIAGIVAPIITGVVVDRSGAFVWAFVIAAGIGLLGVVGWGLIVRRVEPVAWPEAAA